MLVQFLQPTRQSLEEGIVVMAGHSDGHDDRPNGGSDTNGKHRRRPRFRQRPRLC